jgi:hypothetical protein
MQLQEPSTPLGAFATGTDSASDVAAAAGLSLVPAVVAVVSVEQKHTCKQSSDTHSVSSVSESIEYHGGHCSQACVVRDRVSYVVN